MTDATPDPYAGVPQYRQLLTSGDDAGVFYPLRRRDMVVSPAIRRAIEGPNPGRQPHGDHLHGVVFIGFVALKTGVATLDEVLGDHGIVHNFIHCYIHIIGWEDYALDLLEDIESRLKRLSDEELTRPFELKGSLA